MQEGWGTYKGNMKKVEVHHTKRFQGDRADGQRFRLLKHQPYCFTSISDLRMTRSSKAQLCDTTKELSSLTIGHHALRATGEKQSQQV